MSYFLINLEKNVDDTILENIIIDKKIDIDNDNFKYLLYYLDDDTPKEIYLKLPKIRLTHDWSNLKYNQLKVRITPKCQKTDNIILFFNKLEDRIKQNKLFSKKKLEFISVIIKEFVYYIKTFYLENKTMITTDMHRNGVKITDFKNNGEIQMVIRLNNIWQKAGKFGLSSQLYQVKYFAPPDVKNINFLDDEPIINREIVHVTHAAHTTHNMQQSHLPPQTFNPLVNRSEPERVQSNVPIMRPMINSQLLQSVKLKSINQN